ncbi:MAG: PrgI family protein [Clostridia bacterium]|nr:PrgI family protein [Clostridia bacterium]
MIEVKIPKEIRTYKEKLFFGLNLRQTICAALAIVINVPLYIFVRPIIGNDLASWLIIITAVPLFLIGFFQYNGMPFEQFILCILRFQLLTPQKRKYKTENLFAILMEAHQKKVELEKKQRTSIFYKWGRRLRKKKKLEKYLDQKTVKG